MPASRRRGCLVAAIIVLLIAAVLCSGIVFVLAWHDIASPFNQLMNPLEEPIETSQGFMYLLSTKDYTTAFSMIHPSAEQDFGGSPDGLAKFLSDRGMQPTDFTVLNVQVGSDAFVNGTGTFAGATKYVYISLRRDSGTWEIISLQVNDNAPTATPRG